MTTTDPTTVSVAAIKNGTVIDHIDVGNGMKIVKVLKLASHHQRVLLGLNLSSSIMGYKDLIKIEDRELSPKEAEKVAILAPKATVSIITDYNVTKKFPLEMPKKIEEFLSCPNTRCISNNEPIKSVLNVLQRTPTHIELMCHYCKTKFTHYEVQ